MSKDDSTALKVSRGGREWEERVQCPGKREGTHFPSFDLGRGERTMEWTLSAPSLGTVPYHLLQRGCSEVKALPSRLLEHTSLLGSCLSFPNCQIG